MSNLLLPTLLPEFEMNYMIMLDLLLLFLFPKEVEDLPLGKSLPILVYYTFLISSEELTLAMD